MRRTAGRGGSAARRERRGFGSPRATRAARLVLLVCAAGLALAAREPDAAAGAEKEIEVRGGHVNVATIRGSINPASSDYLQRAIAESEAQNAAALLIELDTPGGLVASTKDIIQAILNARVPVIVYVSPRGAWAGSAGTFITLAAHVAAMAPGSSIGAASPVGIGGGAPPSEQGEQGEGQDMSKKKAENLLAAFIGSIAKERDRNVEWAQQAVREAVAVNADEALELNVIDLVAESRAELLRQVDGRIVKLEGRPVRLQVARAEQREYEMGALTRLLNVIVDPNVAVLLMIAGVLGLYIELNQPGLLIPGIVGGVCILLALIALQILPFSWIGLLLIVAGLAFFVAEVFVTSYGLLFTAGILCFLIGGSMLFDKPEVSDLNVSFWEVLVPAVSAMAIFGGIVVYAVGRSMSRRQESGISELIGMVGTASTALDPSGTVAVRGEFWRARADHPVPEGDRVEVVEVRGMELAVRPTRRAN